MNFFVRKRFSRCKNHGSTGSALVIKISNFPYIDYNSKEEK